MSLPDYSSTKEYRDRLAGALAVARPRLNACDFESFANGIKTEIARLDSELSEYHSVVLRPEPNAWTPLSAGQIAIGGAISSIRFNSPRPLAFWRTWQVPPGSNNAFVPSWS